MEHTGKGKIDRSGLQQKRATSGVGLLGGVQAVGGGGEAAVRIAT